MISVYKIVICDTFNNEYFINRDETWSIEKDSEFSSEEDAMLYIITKSMIFTEIKRFLQEIPDEKKDEFIREFLFNDDTYIIYRRFFIGLPDIDKMKRCFTCNGISIKNPILRRT